jgi:hypothetical protein
MRNEETKYQKWQAALGEMQVETDPEKLSEKLQRVETLIQERLQDLYQKGDGSKEREALKEALFTLRIIKRDKLGFPDWE